MYLFTNKLKAAVLIGCYGYLGSRQSSKQVCKVDKWGANIMVLFL